MKIIIIMLLIIAALSTTPAYAEKCLYVSSYHKGYSWSDGVERGLRSILEGKCDLRQFDMNTKRNKGEKNAINAANKALELIKSWKPDVVITSDDNAAKYLIMPHFRDAGLPIVFCGVNWTTDEYEFPYKNVTGIVEVAPIKPMLDQAMKIKPVTKGVYYIGASTPTEKKNALRFEQAMQQYGLPITIRLVETQNEWIQEYKQAQDKADLVIIGSNSGIPSWSEESVRSDIMQSTKTLSVTNHGWMMPYTILGYTKIPEEHGEWAAQAALAILHGSLPTDIPIITNRKWDLWLNTSILDASKIRLPRNVYYKAKKTGDNETLQK